MSAPNWESLEGFLARIPFGQSFHHGEEGSRVFWGAYRNVCGGIYRNLVNVIKSAGAKRLMNIAIYYIYIVLYIAGKDLARTGGQVGSLDLGPLY